MARHTLGLCCALVLCSVLLPRSARAQLTDVREHARQIDHLSLSLGLEGGLFIGARDGEDTALIAPSPVAALRLWEAVIEVAVPVAVLRNESFLNGTQRKARVGNLWAGLSYLPDRSCGLTRLTLGVGAPSARTDGALGARTLRLAAAVHGGWNRQLWTPDLLPLVAGYQTTFPLGRRRLARLVGEGDLTLGLPGGRRQTEVGLQWRGEASVGRSVRFGGRLGANYWPTLQADRFQSHLATFLRYGTRSTWLGAEFTMNLDRPTGFAFRPGGVWGLQLTFLSSL